jgi:hypothetical protein
LDGEVGHEAGWGGAVPVVLAWLEEHTVTGADELYWPALALAEADPLGDVDRLSARVGVPGGARAGGVKWTRLACARLGARAAATASM